MAVALILPAIATNRVIYFSLLDKFLCLQIDLMMISVSSKCQRELTLASRDVLSRSSDKNVAELTQLNAMKSSRSADSCDSFLIRWNLFSAKHFMIGLSCVREDQRSTPCRVIRPNWKQIALAYWFSANMKCAIIPFVRLLVVVDVDVTVKKRQWTIQLASSRMNGLLLH